MVCYFGYLWFTQSDRLMQNVMDGMVEGDRLGLVDWAHSALFTQQDGPVMVEYDQGYFHPDVERDVKKSKRLLAQNPHGHLVRMRVGTQGKDLPMQNNRQFAQVRVTSKDAMEQAAHLAVQLIAKRAAQLAVQFVVQPAAQLLWSRNLRGLHGL